MIWAAAAVVTLFSTVSCREDSEDKVDPNSMIYGTFLQQFDIIYNGILYSYPYWDVDTANIIGRHDYWRAKASELDKREYVDNESLKNIYENMYGTLLDHHMVIQVKNLRPCIDEKDENIRVRPGMNEYSRREGIEPSQISYNHVYEMIDKMHMEGRVTEWRYHYVGKDDFGLMSCLIDDDILYFYLSNFNLYDYRDNDNEDAVKVNEIVDNYLNIISTKQDLKGVIVDVRGNTGGYLLDLYTVLGSLIDSQQLLFSSRKKIGTGMYDYAPFVETYMIPNKRHLTNNKTKIVGLCDILSVSCAEVTSSFIKHLPNGHLMGKGTFGGTCVLDNIYDLEYAGSFGSESGNHYVYMPNSLILYGKERALYEGVGVQPDEIVSYDETLFNEQRKDNQLNAAIDYIHQ